MDAWLPFIIMTAFTILTGVLAVLAGALKRGEE